MNNDTGDSFLANVTQKRDSALFIHNIYELLDTIN